jgi:hypothetical protein
MTPITASHEDFARSPSSIVNSRLVGASEFAEDPWQGCCECLKSRPIERRTARFATLGHSPWSPCPSEHEVGREFAG